MIQKKHIDEIHTMMNRISKIGKCPNCYFERRKHKLILLSPTFNVSMAFKCTRCDGIYNCSDVIACIDMDIKKSKETLVKYSNREPEE